jgi:hypothetical protein
VEAAKVAVPLEDISSQLRALGAGLQMLNEKIDARGQKLSGQIDSLDHRLIRLRSQIPTNIA